ncbi:nitrate- and nitrite sensing domain-containing protein [Streptomyces gilvifuscus]|uniref:histidine kinase n=1 Tax=Streptomyces gilvifuscus TaxID=1550617 RepID=A0ABT5FWU8_9ACTN|nr:nitrate- and nitrite sensing domain-containing protein [Streptomyces gilvifuscus]MDC2956935.1 nitrate- and nitrite sensing domain-containing protein [Streptomyces gilvifuscus]
MSPRTGARPRRLGSIRLSLILLALVPSVTLAAMWGVTTTQMFTEGLRLRGQTQLSRSTGAMGTEATLALQRERSLSAAWLSGDPRGSRAALEAQRRTTDKAVAKLVGQSDAISKAPARISDRLYSVLGSVGSLEYYRGQVDKPTDITSAQALGQYGSIIDDQIHAFQELSQVDDGDLTSQAGPLVALEHAAELVAQEDAQLTLAWPTGKLTEKEWSAFSQLVATRRWLVEDQIVPSLQGGAKAETERILQSPEWRTVQDIEDQVLAARPGADGRAALPDARDRWAASFATVGDEYGRMIRSQTSVLLDRSADKAHNLLLTAASLSAGGLIALLLCVGMSWRITRSLSRRLRGLREATLSLAEERLPDVVARLDRGEKVDADEATPPLDYGRDELGQVARAFNKAQRTAVHTAVELADTRRGFQKVILGIARQSQNLVNLQLTKLDTLEREHTDPDVLKGLYELDSTASQLRRYEENLVIISGEQPRRSWREPVALIDIMRSAVGEVAEYARVEVHTDEDVYLAPPAVADVIHLLAELIDNATAYSPAPAPVSVRAALVAKGLAVEIEDRGLGMSEEDYASFNEQLAVEPQFDVVALADDLRLGMFVIARLATRHGIAVTLRPSPYGGTTAIVLIPHDVVVREAPEPGTADAAPGRARHGSTGTDTEYDDAAYADGEHTRATETGPSAEPDHTAPPSPGTARPDGTTDTGIRHAEATGHADDAGYAEAARRTEGTRHAEATGYTEGTWHAGGSEHAGTAERPTTTGRTASAGPTADAARSGVPDGGADAERARADARTGDADRGHFGELGGLDDLGDPGDRADRGPLGARDADTEPGRDTEGPDRGRLDRLTAYSNRLARTRRIEEAVWARDGRAKDGRAASGSGRTEADDPGREADTHRAGGADGSDGTGPWRSAGAGRADGAPGGGAPGRSGEAEAGRRPGWPGGAGRRPGLAPLPRRVPQSSLAAELREDLSGEEEGQAGEFTAERAASSLGGFQRGTLRARDDDAGAHDDREENPVPQDQAEPDAGPADTGTGTHTPSPPPADR